MIEQTKISKSKLDALKLSLPHGSLIKIARELGLDRRTVDDVFRGKFDNEDVIDRAIEIVEAAKQRKIAREARIDQALNS